MSAGAALSIEIVYAEAQRCIVAACQFPGPATVADALARAAADPRFAGIDVAGLAVGIFGRLVPPGQPLQHGDRVELYRRLPIDPKKARRNRAGSMRSRGAAAAVRAR